MRTARLGIGSFHFVSRYHADGPQTDLATFACGSCSWLFGFAHSSKFEELFALNPQQALPWRPWQLLTYMFLHSAPSQGGGFSPLHILLNMLTLLMFGGPVERQLGARRFLRYYLICGLAGGLLILLPPFRDVTIGASGAVLGVLTAFGVLYPDAPVLLFFIPVPAKVLVIFVALLNLFSAAGASGESPTRPHRWHARAISCCAAHRSWPRHAPLGCARAQTPRTAAAELKHTWTTSGQLTAKAATA